MPSPLVQTVGAKWREMAFDDTAWVPTEEERPGGEAEGFWVSSGELRGYLKPSKDAADIAAHPRAAHESRIPASHLLASHAECIVDGLCRRRSQICDAIGPLGQR